MWVLVIHFTLPILKKKVGLAGNIVEVISSESGKPLLWHM